MSILDNAVQSVGGPVPPLESLASSLTDLLSSFASAFSQANRLLKLHFSADSGIPANKLLPHRLTGWEEINGGCRWELEVLSSDDTIQLKTLIGQPVEITILTDAGADQRLCGIVTGSSQLGSDGGFSRFRLIVESGLAALAQRTTARVFTQTNVRTRTAQILCEHLAANPVLAACFALEDRCSRTYPERPFALQYNETDTDYLQRIWAQEGISYVILPGEEISPEHPQHKLLIFDDVFELDVNASPTARFHRADGTEERDAITQWSAHRALQSGAVARTAWNHASATSHGTSEANAAPQGDYGHDLASTLEDYTHEPNLEEHGPDPFAELATRRADVKAQRTGCFSGAGSVRTFQAGTWFTLTQHPNHTGDDRAFVLTRVEVDAVNNLPKDLESGLAALLKAPEGAKALPYRNRFTGLRRGVPMLPEEIQPPIPGLLTARVVGPGSEDVHTDPLGRIKLRFLFTRDAEHPESGASETDADSAWVRQAETWSSQGFAANFIPRVGDEVLVGFLGDDPDKPVVLGSLANGARPPASFSRVSALPLDKALSGFRSRMFGGSTGNELVLDDTRNELRARLASDHERSELNLGHLVHPRSGGVADPKGEGFELRTDAWGAVRAEQGLLLSTDGRTGASGNHADPTELLQQTQSALDLTKALSDASENHQAQKLAVNEQTKRLKTVAEAKQSHASGDTREDVAAFKEAILALSSPAGIVEGTPGTIVKATGKHFQLTSGQDTNLAVGRRLALAIQDAWSVVALQGIKLFAGRGDIAIQAHAGNLDLTSEKDLSLVACKQGVDLAAAKQAVLAAGGAKVVLENGGMTFFANVNCKAKWNVIMPQAKTYDMPTLVKVEELQNRYFVVRSSSGEPVPNSRYAITTDEGKKLTGITDAKGQTCRVTTRTPNGVKIQLLEQKP